MHELARSQQNYLVRNVYRNEVPSVYGHWVLCCLSWLEVSSLNWSEYFSCRMMALTLVSPSGPRDQSKRRNVGESWCNIALSLHGLGSLICFILINMLFKDTCIQLQIFLFCKKNNHQSYASSSSASTPETLADALMLIL